MKTVLLVWLWVSVAEVSRSHDACVDGKTQNIRLTFTNKRNETGHYQSQVRITRIDREPGLSRFPWKMELEQGVSQCGDTRIKYIQYTYNDPTSSAQDYNFYPFLGRYKLHTTAKTWFEAFQVCQEEGAHLAVINSDEEAQILKEMFESSPQITGALYNTAAFVGFSDLVKEGNFVTVLGQPLSATGYSKFYPGEPNNAGGNPGQDCGALLKGTDYLDDATCSIKLAFFCEQEI